MGVRGLTTYVNYNQTLFLKDYILHDSNLVIDGHSLCAQLYRSSNCFSAFGGDYDKFAAVVKNFLKSLNKCNISCYVLFDGSYETRKLKTAYSRLRSKIKGASRLDPVTQSSLQIIPLLLRDTFKEILLEMKIPYTICEFEADDEIAAMARRLNCPVLSYDSDFFIYNVLYVPFNTLDLKPTVFEEEGIKKCGMKCKMFKVKYLVDNFGGLDEEMLPLFATLLGNDYVQKKMFKNFFSQLKLPKGKNKKNDQQRSIHGLLKWLQSETLDSALTKIIGRMKKNDKRKIFHLLKKSMEGYNRKDCRSLQFFNFNVESTPTIAVEMPDIDSDGEDESATDEEECDEDISNNSVSSSSDEVDDDCDNQIAGLPEWFANKIRENAVPQTYIDFFTLKLHFTTPQAEDYTDEDASMCTLNIMKYAFDLLTDFSQENLIFISREKDCEYKRITIDLEFSLSRPSEKNFCEMSQGDLHKCFKYFVNEKLSGLDLDIIGSLPSNFRLVMLAMLMWVSHCAVPASLVHSMFLCYVMLDVVDEKTGTFRGHHFFNNKYNKKLQELKKEDTDTTDFSELFLNKNKVSYEDCMLAAGVLLEHFEISNEIRKRPKTYDVKIIHKLAQFQCFLQQFNCLNILCANLYKTTTYSKFYNGTFVYNLAAKLESQSDCVLFIEKYLIGANSVLHFYKSLCKVFDECLERLGLSLVSEGFKKRKTRRGRKKQVDREISFLAKYFESEVII